MSGDRDSISDNDGTSGRIANDDSIEDSVSEPTSPSDKERVAILVQAAQLNVHNNNTLNVKTGIRHKLQLTWPTKSSFWPPSRR